MTNPPDHNGRAPYALPEGVPALQEDPARTRRWLLATGALCLAGGAGLGYWAGRDLSVVSAGASISSRREWARRVAASPAEVVLQNISGFLVVVDAETGDELLWLGLEKLVDLALKDPELVSGPATLRERVLPTLRLRRDELPRSLAAKARLLESPPKMR